MSMRKSRTIGLAVGGLLLASMRLIADVASPALDAQYELQSMPCAGIVHTVGAMSSCASWLPERAVLGHASDWLSGPTTDPEASWLGKAGVRM